MFNVQFYFNGEIISLFNVGIYFNAQMLWLFDVQFNFNYENMLNNVHVQCWILLQCCMMKHMNIGGNMTPYLNIATNILRSLIIVACTAIYTQGENVVRTFVQNRNSSEDAFVRRFSNSQSLTRRNLLRYQNQQ